MSLDYAALSRQLIKRLRGKRSQKHLSQRLGYKSNQIHRWENGSNQITWCRFIDLCENLQIPIASIVGDTLLHHGNPRNVESLIGVLIGGVKRSEIARELGVSRHILARWLNGKADPPLTKILKLIEITTRSLVVFVDRLSAPHTLPELYRHRERLIDQKMIYYEDPWTLAILAALDSGPYRSLKTHKAGWLASNLGLSHQQEKETIEKLAAHKIIRFENGKFELNQAAIHTDLVPEFKVTKRSLQYWMRRSLAYIEKAEQRNPSAVTWGYKVFNVSKQDYERLRELYATFYHELTTIVSTTKESADTTMYFSAQLMRIDVLPPDPAAKP